MDTPQHAYNKSMQLAALVGCSGSKDVSEVTVSAVSPINTVEKLARAIHSVGKQKTGGGADDADDVRTTTDSLRASQRACSRSICGDFCRRLY